MGIKAGEDTFYQAQRGIVQDGLVLNLDAGVDESYSGGTVWRDLSENGNNVSLVNSPTWAKTKGGIFEFDGSNDRGDVALSTYSSFSTFFFIRYIYIAGWNFAIDTLNGTHQMTFHASSSGAGNIAVIGPGNPLITIDSYSNLSTKNWFYFGATYDGSTLTAYKNGISVGSTSVTGNINMSRTGIAARYGTGEHNNRVDFGPIHMYNRALTAAEVLQNYNATRHRFGV